MIGVYLSLYASKTFLPNDSIIAYTDISIQRTATEDTGSLVCNTDKIGCCATTQEGDWYLANGSTITQDNEEFSVTRSDDGEVILFRNTEIISSPSTLCCRVLDANNMNQTVCVHSG